MTYKVSSGTLNLCSLTHSLRSGVILQDVTRFWVSTMPGCVEPEMRWCEVLFAQLATRGSLGLPDGRFHFRLGRKWRAAEIARQCLDVTGGIIDSCRFNCTKLSAAVCYSSYVTVVLSVRVLCVCLLSVWYCSQQCSVTVSNGVDQCSAATLFLCLGRL